MMTKTEIDFVTGFDTASPTPAFVKAAGLKHRVAVIQHTYRPDSVDMYFDEPLWRRLLEFAVQFNPGNQVEIIDRKWATGAVNRNWQRGTTPDPKKADEVRAETFLSAWDASDDPYRDPPEYIVVRDGGSLVLCIATEYWTQVGGPAPYADSYTYSIFSADDLTERVIDSLVKSEAAQGWKLPAARLQSSSAA